MQIQVADATLTVEMSGNIDSDGRDIYALTIVTPTFEHSDHSIKSGCLGGTEAKGMRASLSFLFACAEGMSFERCTSHKSDNADLFPRHVGEWAFAHADELAMAMEDVEQGISAGMDL